jgi:predicted transcriptional regulator of viral defense system
VDITTLNDPSSARDALSALSRRARQGLITTQAAAQVLGVTPRVAAARLARLVDAGWVTRVRRGLYLILPLEAANARSTTIEDPWVLADMALSPCYIGGWSAAEHWGLTEQIFRSTFVVTAAGVRSRTRTLLGAEFHLVRVPRKRITGAVQVWRGPTRVLVSDRERTIADGLLDPTWLGGARHLIQVLTAYRRSPEWNSSRLLARLAELGRGAAYKRLGFLAEHVLDGAPSLIAACLDAKSAGLIKLDPALSDRGRLVKRWGLWVNTGLPESEYTD